VKGGGTPDLKLKDNELVGDSARTEWRRQLRPWQCQPGRDGDRERRELEVEVEKAAAVAAAAVDGLVHLGICA
jgi:hypothetical protein